MAGVIITAIFILFVYLDEKGKKERAEQAKKSRQTRYAAHQAKQRTSARKVNFQPSRGKAAAFEKFISWAKQEAKFQGKAFHLIAGENDYQKARQVFQDSEKWKQLRRTTLARYPSCLRCGTRDKLQVDHVVPMVLRPDMFNHESNLQTLCGPCNRWKGTEAIDFRSQSRKPLASSQRTSPARVERKLKVVRTDRRSPEVPNRYDGPTAKQQAVRAVLALSPEQRKQHEKRVAQEIVAERRAAQERRQTAKSNRSKPKRNIVAVKKGKSCERAFKVSENLETWRRANEQRVIEEVRLRWPMRETGRFDWYLCERAFREAEYQQQLTQHVRFSYLGRSEKSSKPDYSRPSDKEVAEYRAKRTDELCGF